MGFVGTFRQCKELIRRVFGMEKVVTFLFSPLKAKTFGRRCEERQQNKKKPWVCV